MSERALLRGRWVRDKTLIKSGGGAGAWLALLTLLACFPGLRVVVFGVRSDLNFQFLQTAFGCGLTEKSPVKQVSNTTGARHTSRRW